MSLERDPDNDLLGGKLVSYLLASNEVREMYAAKYMGRETIIKKRSATDLAMIHYYQPVRATQLAV